jgi:hypothetical protein
MNKILAYRNSFNFIPYNNASRLIATTRIHLKQPVIKESTRPKPNFTQNKPQKQFKYPRELSDKTPQNTYKKVVKEKDIQIKTKLQSLNYLSNLSDKLINEFKQMKMISSIKMVNYELKKYDGSQEFSELRSSVKSSKEFNTFLDYLNANFGEFNPNEKAILLNILAKLVDSNENAKLNEVLFKIESDYYDNIEKLSLIDMFNYNEGFHLIRSSNTHFVSKSAEVVYRLNVNVIHKYFKDRSAQDSKKTKKQVKKEANGEADSEQKVQTDIDQKVKVEKEQKEQAEKVETAPVELSENEKQALKIIESINKSWTMDFYQNDLILSLNLFRKLTSYYTLYGKSYLFNALLGDRIRYVKEDSIETKHTVLMSYLSEKRLSLFKINKSYLDLLMENFFSLYENMNKINDNYSRLALLNVLTSYSEILKKDMDRNKSDQYKFLDKYKMETLQFFFKELKTTNNIIDFSLLNTCISKSIKSLHLNNKASFLLNSFNNLDPAYSGIVGDFETKGSIFETVPLVKNAKLTEPSYINILKEKFFSFRKFLNTQTIENMYFATKNNELCYLNQDIAEHFSKMIFDKCKMSKTSLTSDDIRVLSMLSKDNKFELTLDCLDKIYQCFESKRKDKEDLLGLINVLIGHKFYSTVKMKILFGELDTIVHNNVEDVFEILQTLSRNIDYFFENHPDQTRVLVLNVFSRVITKLEEFDFNRENKLDASVLSEMAMCLLKFKMVIKFELLENIRLDNLNRFILSASKADPRLDLKQNIKNAFHILKSLADIQTLAEPSNDNLLVDIMSYSARVLHLMNDTNLFVKCLNSSIEKHFDADFIKPKQLVDLLTVFGLFNYYDLNSMTKDVVKISKINRCKKDIETLNTIVYDLIKNFSPLNHELFIYYNLSLVNLNVENRKSILDLFSRFTSFDDFKNQFDHLNR